MINFSFSFESSWQPNIADVGRIINVRWFDDRRTAASQRGSEIETWIDWSTRTSNELIESIVNKCKYLKIVCYPILLSTSDSLSIPPDWVCVVFMLSFSMLTWTNKRFMRNRIDSVEKLLLLWKSSELQSFDTLSGFRFASLELTCGVWTSQVLKLTQALHLLLALEQPTVYDEKRICVRQTCLSRLMTPITGKTSTFLWEIEEK